MKPACCQREAIWLCWFFCVGPRPTKKLVFFSAARRALLFALLHFLLPRLARIVTSGAFVVDFPSLHKRENSLRFPFLLRRNAIKLRAARRQAKNSRRSPALEAYLIIVSAAGLDKWERETRSSERATDRVTWFAAHQHFRMYPASLLFSLRGGGVFLLLWFIQQHFTELEIDRIPSESTWMIYVYQFRPLHCTHRIQASLVLLHVVPGP